MNRRTLLTTLLSGLSAGVAAIAGRKNAVAQKGFNADTHDNHGSYHLFNHDRAYCMGTVKIRSSWDVENLPLRYEGVLNDGTLIYGTARYHGKKVWLDLMRNELVDFKRLSVHVAPDYAQTPLA